MLRVIWIKGAAKTYELNPAPVDVKLRTVTRDEIEAQKTGPSEGPEWLLKLCFRQRRTSSASLHHLIKKILGCAQSDVGLIVKFGSHFLLRVPDNICSGIRYVRQTSLS